MDIIVSIVATLAVVGILILYRIGILARQLQRYLESDCEQDCDQGRRCTCYKNSSGKR